MRTAERLRVAVGLLGGLGAVSAPSAEALQDFNGGSALQNAGISRSLTGNSSAGAAHSNRVDPRLQGVNITFSPTRFNYVHDYPFENLSKEATAVYFLLPLNCQEHTISSAKYTVVGSTTPLKYDVVAETPGWKVARAEVPPSKNFTVRMEVKGVHWNGHLARSASEVSDIAPPFISDEQMHWYGLKSSFLSPVEGSFNQFLKDNNLVPLSEDFFTAFQAVAKAMAAKFTYQSGAHTIENMLNNGVGNCNGMNGFLESAFDSSPGYVGVALNGIVMEGGQIHAMSFVGKDEWRYLVPTDGVKINKDNVDPLSLSGAARTMLLFQAGFGDPAKDPKGGVTFRPTETGRIMRAPNPGGLMMAYGEGVGSILSYGGGRKVSFESQPVKPTEYAALKKELGLVSQANGGAIGGEATMNVTDDILVTVTSNQSNPLSELLFSRHR